MNDVTFLALSQMKHQLDATLCRFYFCRVTLHISGVKRPSSGAFKTGTEAPGTCVIVAGKSSHILIRAGTAVPALIRRSQIKPQNKSNETPT